MKRFLLFCSFLALPLMSAPAQPDCRLPLPFDHNSVYTSTIFVAPGGSDDVGDGSQSKPFRTLGRACRDMAPGIRIFLEGGEHVPGQYIDNLQGTAAAPILITCASDDPAVFTGGSEAIHLSEAHFVIIENITVQDCTGNGINIDDGSHADTPAHHAILRGITVRRIGPDGNRDAIKLSGLENFRIERCLIESPGSSGSGIDMVGCHDGIIAHNTFREIAGNAVQTKGGSARVLIYANRFESGGMRAVNMGGSTGLPFFRPPDASYEAAHITVWANLFMNTDTPVAFVGCENGLFAHNVVYRPRRWVARILQETVGERFVPSRNNVFANNLVVIDNQVSTLVNIGANTDPDSFRFAGNLWYHLERPDFSRLDLPGTVTQSLVQQDPGFIAPADGNFHLQPDSPALRQGVDLRTVIEGLEINLPEIGDLEGNCFAVPPAIGAYREAAQSRLNIWEVQKNDRSAP